MPDSYESREFNSWGATIVCINAIFWGVVGGFVGKWLMGDPLDLPRLWAGIIGGSFFVCIGPAVLLIVGPLVGAAFFTTYRRVR